MRLAEKLRSGKLRFVASAGANHPWNSGRVLTLRTALHVWDPSFDGLLQSPNAAQVSNLLSGANLRDQSGQRRFLDGLHAVLPLNSQKNIRKLQQALIGQGYYFIIYVNNEALEHIGEYKPDARATIKVDVYRVSNKHVLKATLTDSEGDAFAAKRPFLHAQSITPDPLNRVWKTSDFSLFAGDGDFIGFSVIGEGMGAILQENYHLDPSLKKNELSIAVGASNRHYDCSMVEIDTALCNLAQMLYSPPDKKALIVSSTFHLLMQSFGDPYWNFSAELMLDIYNVVMKKALAKETAMHYSEAQLVHLEHEFIARLTTDPELFDRVMEPVFLSMLGSLAV